MRSEPRSARTPVWPLSLSLAATNKIDVSFSSSGYLDVSVHRVPPACLCIQHAVTGVLPDRFPHSDICGSRIICISPQLFAAYHVLHRLLMPRHSPYALLSLTIFELCLILLIFMLIAGFLPDFNFRYCRSFFLICITFAFHYSIFKFRSLQDLSCWWAQVDSNHRPHAYQACALTT